MKKLRKYFPIIILIVSFIVGAFFRFYKLGESPSGFYIDEASLGYSAFSILKTGNDEFGKLLPTMFRSFTTFQSPVYTYLTVPLIAIWGLNPFSVRLLSALLGLLTLPMLYLLVKKISPEKYSHKLALISTVFLSISPWHIQYSRTAYETNIALFFLILGSLLFFYSLKKPWLFIISSISFAISLNSYRAEVLIVPLLLFVLLFRFRQHLFKNIQSFLPHLVLASIVGLILIIPMLIIVRTPGFQSRTSSLNIFSSSIQNPWGHKENSENLPNIINNTKLLSVKEYLSLYSSYFSPRFLFSLGDSGPRKPYPDLGTFFVWQFPLLLVGFYFLLKEKELKDLRCFVLVLLILSPVLAAFTRDPYSTVRSLSMVVPLIIIVSFGLVKILAQPWSFINKYKYWLVFLLLIFSSIKMFISIFYFNDYYTSRYWNHGWQLAAERIKDLDPNLPIIVDNSRGHSYILLLFFLKYDPSTYQKDNFEVAQDEYYTKMERVPTKYLGRITVRNFVWGSDTDDTEQYIIADGMAISDEQIKDHNMTIIEQINFPSGEVALSVLKTNPETK